MSDLSVEPKWIRDRKLRYHCGDCGCEVGMPHTPGCDVERCTACGGQRMVCTCPGHDPALAAWTGEWPDLVEARRLRLFCYGPPWVPCEPDHPEATEDLNRLAMLPFKP